MPKRHNHLRLTYNMSEEHYSWLFYEQGGKCAICESEDPKHKSGMFQVDHCHTTGKVRGLLCSNCNTALGKLNDDPELVAIALEYLRTSGINKDLSEANLPDPTIAKRKPITNGRKMVHSTAQLIRSEYASGSTQSTIANKYGISQAMVSAIVLNKQWKDSDRK